MAKTKRLWKGKEGYRLKTIKLKQQLSQGLALPMSMFAKEANDTSLTINNPDSTWADWLGVELWEEEVNPQLAGFVKSNFPQFIPKTDQERLQNIYRQLDPNAKYEVTVKEDGTSLTVYKKDDVIGICSRNLDLKMGEENKDNLYIKAATESGLLEIVRNFECNIAIQAEIVGPGINGNKAKYKDFSVRIFDMYDIDNRYYYESADRLDYYNSFPKNDYPFKLLHCNVLGTIDHSAIDTLQKALAFADGVYKTGELREGVVLKNINGNGSFKIISNAFLLKHGL